MISNDGRIKCALAFPLASTPLFTLDLGAEYRFSMSIVFPSPKFRDEMIEGHAARLFARTCRTRYWI